MLLLVFEMLLRTVLFLLGLKGMVVPQLVGSPEPTGQAGEAAAARPKKRKKDMTPGECLLEALWDRADAVCSRKPLPGRHDRSRGSPAVTCRTRSGPCAVSGADGSFGSGSGCRHAPAWGPSGSFSDR